MKRMLPLLSFFLFLGCLAPIYGAVTPASPEEALKTTGAVFQLFQDKCNDCHGAHLEKPKGKFGYLMDFKKVADNADYIVPGEPGKSEFFRLVDEDEMPGKKSDVPAATAAEKATLKHWIEIGAPAELPKELEAKRVELLNKKKGSASDNEGKASSKPPKPFLEKLLSWIGRFHAASTHIPVGLLSVAVLAEMLAWFTKKESWLTCTRFLVVIGAGGAVATATLGWLNDFSGASTVYQIHKWLGTATAVWGILSAGCAVLFECREGTLERSRLRITLLIGALAVSITGFLGGAITFGLDHYKW